jgi:hypothetical protein
MPKGINFKIFISHASADQHVATALCDLICNALRLDKGEVFVSSSPDSIRLGDKDEVQITEAHKSAMAVVALMTPRSIFRPWVIYEAGGANFQSAKPLFVVLSNGATVDCLPSPLKVWHAGSLSEKANLYNLCRSLAKVIGTLPVTPDEKDLKRVTSLAKVSAGDWESVNVSLVAEKAANSPFALNSILDETSPQGAKREIFIFGQNLHFLTKGQAHNDYFRLISAWLKVNKTRRFTAVITDFRCKDVVKAWQRMYGEIFRRHLFESRNVLKRWLLDSKEESLNIRVLVANFIPTTAVFVDPHDNHGYMILTPTTYRSMPTEKPHFILGKKQNKVVFDYYWFAYDERIRDGCKTLS